VAGIPLSVPLLARVTPAGRAPVSEKVGTGYPVAVTWKQFDSVPLQLTAPPARKVALLALVMCGGSSTVTCALTVCPSAVVGTPSMPPVPPAVYVVLALPLLIVPVVRFTVPSVPLAKVTPTLGM
jgi:hypothetical protein